MMDKVKIRIEEDEWAEAPKEVRTRIIQLMKEYGYDTQLLEALEREIEPSLQDIYKQFYGDEE